MNFLSQQNSKVLFIALFSTFIMAACSGKQSVITLMDSNDVVSLVVDNNENETVKLSATLFAEDVQRITGKKPQIIKDINDASGHVIVFGTIEKSGLIQTLSKQNKIDYSSIQGNWEMYQYHFVDDITENKTPTLVIVGSDPRGAAYGILDLSKKMGVSPWYYWADVTPERKDNLSVEVSNYTSSAPSVKFRGIFLNDEDWGLQPWAANTLEPETNDIGPKTYAHIFELLLRLKANLIWPAMHPCTRGFFTYPGNIEVAEKYGIVIGSSHCEQMLCNNVDEWKEPEFGPFNYFTNKDKMIDYWAKRVEESKNINGIYTLGLRGVHDSGIVGAKNTEQKISATNEVIKVQRNLLDSIIPKDVTEIPQVMIPYKEVLAIYDKGIDLPEDISLVWPDDNYGYVRRLSDKNERLRSGGSGVYYHASYWGRPHDYLWLSSTNPWVMWEEMFKSYTYDAKTFWILNVGDIKPLERDIDLFLDMAWDITSYSSGNAVLKHMQTWYSDIFGTKVGKEVTDITQKYYQLAFERRPEFMGWSRTEGRDRNTHISGYNHFVNGDEAQKRMDRYAVLSDEVKRLYSNFDNNDVKKAAFYQLVYYPVVMASEINHKFLYRDKAEHYKKQGRSSVNEFAQLSDKAFASIQKETKYFNTELQNGKWNHMMSYEPRNLSVYQKLSVDKLEIPENNAWGISVETSLTDTSSNTTLPVFYPWYQDGYFIDIYMKGTEEVSWQLSTDVPWLNISQDNGNLTNSDGNREVRVWIKINWSEVYSPELLKGLITITANGQTESIKAIVNNFSHPDLISLNVPIENNGVVSIFAENFKGIKNAANSQWEKLDGLGHTGSSMRHAVKDEVALQTNLKTAEKAALAYDFIIVTSGETSLTVFALPTHPINRNWGLGVKIFIDGQELGVASVKARSQTALWKENVLSNTASTEISLGELTAGKHQIIVEAIDPEFILDRLLIKTEECVQNTYSVIPEVRLP